MLKRFFVRNYKAFSDASIELRALTLLLGPNNSGKTCLIEVLLLMQQTAEAAQGGDGAPVKLNGSIVSLGTIKHVFHNCDTGTPLTFGFQFSSPSLASDFAAHRDEFTRTVYALYRDYFRYYTYLVEKEGERRKLPAPETFWIDFRNITDLKKEEATGTLLDMLTTLRGFDQDSQGDDIISDVLFVKLPHRGQGQSRGYTLPDLRLTADFLLAITQPGTPDFTIDFDITYARSDESLVLTRIALHRSSALLLEVSLDKTGSEVIDIESTIIPQTGRFKNYYTSIASSMRPRAPVFSLFKRDSRDQRHQISRAVASVCRGALDRLRSCFTRPKLSHVSPIRAYPRRFYLGEQGHDIQGEGVNLIELLRDNKELKKKANIWLKRFGISVDVERLREVLHRLAIHQEGLEVDLDITDVGFGVSQVLPVLVDALRNPSGGLSLVEQPEIHLHPKMQAELTDFFLDVVAATRDSSDDDLGCCFLIETHSVSLLRRLRSRLVSKDPNVSPDTVAIYNIGSPQGETPVADPAPISSDGKFPWPRGFLEVELEETIGYLGFVNGE